MQQLIRIGIFFFLLLSGIMSSGLHTSADDSSLTVMDMSESSLYEDGLRSLDGEWGFYWETFLDPGEPLPDPDALIQVPAEWTSLQLDGSPLPHHGYATYHIRLQLHEEDLNHSLAIYMANVSTAYDLFINGEAHGGQGVTADNREDMEPENFSTVYFFDADTPEVDVVIHVSDYYQRSAGIWESVRIGTASDIVAERESNTLIQMFILGGIFLIGLYHLILFLIRSKDPGPLYFSILCFSIGIRTLLLRDTLMFSLMPWISWSLAVNLEYISALMSLIFILLFLRSQLPDDLPKRVVVIAVSLIGSYLVFVAVTPTWIFRETNYVLYVLAIFATALAVYYTVVALVRRRDGAMLYGAGMLVLFIAVANDVLYYAHVLETDGYVAAGLLFFLFIQSIQLSRKYARSFNRAEGLSAELHEMNEQLETRVKERTAELKQANNHLQKMERSRRQLFASISHELNTPLTFIQGYIKAMIDGVIDRDDSKYLRSIYTDTTMMSAMIRDLQDLSKLESDQVSFDYQTVDGLDFFTDVIQEQSWMIEKKNNTTIITENELDHNHKWLINVDPVRIKQVFSNLVLNAIKHASKGKEIVIRLTSVKRADGCHALQVCVKDFGEGIPKEDIPFVFDRFYKLEKDEINDSRGAGLGLAIAKEIVELHDGEISVESELGEGSVFSFRLPIDQVTKSEGGEHYG
ncbi:sensor histidine kinase [Salisediminibacterium beveridgei]|uniref:histidine kinase n=1 Tax=Salisediminibacterium beveridgei TaxID=632773 RepID=A0A1D7QS89_9BACI|nr:sensor histidine kinase [Salisediminibacterium beveridgei]AOM81859.1 Sensor histidine kinase resE [Salisediminibacterium beveridgei]